jgi:hypothetical protein
MSSFWIVSLASYHNLLGSFFWQLTNILSKSLSKSSHLIWNIPQNHPRMIPTKLNPTLGNKSFPLRPKIPIPKIKRTTWSSQFLRYLIFPFYKPCIGLPCIPNMVEKPYLDKPSYDPFELVILSIWMHLQTLKSFTIIHFLWCAVELQRWKMDYIWTTQNLGIPPTHILLKYYFRINIVANMNPMPK